MNTIQSTNERQTSTERRRHARASVVLHGRYMLPDQREFKCTTRYVSVSGVNLLAPEQGNVGDRVIVYIDIIGRLDGTIVRQTRGGFALNFKLPAMKVEKLADQLTWLLNRDKLGMAEDRRHERITPRHIRSELTLPDGARVPCRLIDISVSGAAVTAEVKPEMGALVTIGNTQGRVVRVFDKGVAIEFFRAIPPELFDESLVL